MEEKEDTITISPMVCHSCGVSKVMIIGVIGNLFLTRCDHCGAVGFLPSATDTEPGEPVTSQPTKPKNSYYG